MFGVRKLSSWRLYMQRSLSRLVAKLAVCNTLAFVRALTSAIITHWESYRTMAVYAGKAEFEQGGRSTLPTISCPECGVPTIARDDGFLCLDCVRATYDWRAPLEAHLKKHPKLLTLRRCTGCERVETTAANKKERRWERAERDTDELLAVLLRRVKAQLFGKKALDLVDGLSAGLKAGDPLALRDAAPRLDGAALAAPEAGS